MKTQVKLVSLLLLLMIIGCQIEDDSSNDIPLKLQNFMEKNNLKVAEEAVDIAYSFENMEEAQLFLNQLKEEINKSDLIQSHKDPIKKEHFGKSSNNSTPIAITNIYTLILNEYSTYSLRANITYTYCNGNGNFINTPYEIISFLSGFHPGIVWNATSQYAEYRGDQVR